MSTKRRKIVRTIKTGIVLEGLDLQNPKSFHGINDARHFVGRTSRSVSEAFRDANYACALERHSSDLRHAVRWFSDFFVVLFWGSVALTFPFTLIYWLTR
jgi:hypothetical protein